MRVSTKRSYDSSFREQAVALLERSGRSLPAVALGLGIPDTTLRYWYKKSMGTKGKKAVVQPPPNVPVQDPLAESAEDKLKRLERENAELRQEVEELKMDRAILKKAAAFFAKESE